MKLHPTTGLIAYDDHDSARGAVWSGEAELYQRCSGAGGLETCVRVWRYPDGQTVIMAGGANAIRAGRYAWHSMLVTTSPTVTTSTGRTYPNHYEGAVAANADVSVILDAAKRKALVLTPGGERLITLPGGVFGSPWITQDGDWLIVTCFVTGGDTTLLAVNLFDSEIVFPETVTPHGNNWGCGFVLDGQLWVIYQSAHDMLVCHPADNPRKRIDLTGFKALTYGVDACVIGDELVVAWAGGAAEFRSEAVTRRIPLSTLRGLTEAPIPVLPPKPEPKPDNFGQHGPERPQGFVYADLAEFYVGAPETFPRTGTHTVTQTQPRADGSYEWGKFYDPPKGFNDKRYYEQFWLDAEAIHMTMDSTARTYPDPVNPGGPPVPVCGGQTDTRWMLRRMAVGQAFDPPPFEIFECDWNGRETGRAGWERKMTLYQAWAQFDCGPDLGVREVILVVHDPTARDWAHDRGVELYWLAKGVGVVAWEYHRSDRCCAETGGIYRFDTYSRVSRSVFYQLGGTPWAPERTPRHYPILVPTQEISVQLPQSVRNTILAFAAANPLPQGDGSEAWLDSALRDGWMRRCVETVVFHHGRIYGQKRRGPGAPISAGRIARVEPNGRDFYDFDILVGAGTGRPVLDVNVESDGLITDQEFLPRDPVNHLAPQQPHPGRAPWPATVRHGVSAFDVAARVAGGDRGWYDFTAPLPLNVFVYATIDHPATYRVNRTFAEGLAQTEALLQRLVADRRQAMFVMLSGPANRDGVKLNRAQALDMVRQEVALFNRYPSAVLALSLGNELFQQGFEADFMLDPSFWAEVEALIPLNFPFAIGQVGETVVFGPGSCAMMHPDRGKGSLEALQILAEAQSRDGRTVIAREPARIEEGGSGQSRGSLAFVEEELANAARLGLPYFLHPAAGRGCDMRALDTLQRNAVARVKAAAGASVPVPPTFNPFLDTDMRVPTLWYPLFVTQHAALRDAIAAEYRAFTGNPASPSDIAHNLYRGAFEVTWWHTMRNAIRGVKVGG